MRPMLHEVHMVFGPVEAWLDELSTGFANYSLNHETRRMEPIFRAPEGDMYAALPAVRGLISTFIRLMADHGMQVDFSPAVRLLNKLEADMPINQGNIDEAAAVFRFCKDAYRRMDVFRVRQIVNTELIAYEFEKKGLTA